MYTWKCTDNTGTVLLQLIKQTENILNNLQKF